MNKPNTLVWDIPTRLFHWLLVAGFAAQWLTAKILDNAIDWHFTIGYCLLALVLFRLCWGFVGTRYARFTAFIYSPGATWQYAKTVTDRHSTPHASHNPMGGWMVIVMLILIALQAVSGLFVSDDIFSDGPYRALADENVKEWMEFVHFNLFDVLLIIVALHIAAVLFYQFYKKNNLIGAMITGKKKVSSPAIKSSRLLLAVGVAALIGLFVYLLVAVWPPQPEPMW
ncbi:cytochrome b/b6 domain-containing protein [Alteromonas oceanisediminis]|uniref:cytochrome b/b6 domain-containing protein n=1 Tax=Alteromonas oceanisediminis TaxID=2836180 RepID=UPI001BD9F341|nr:cytochrome b/b6 domain-containing protein [Alteromonas oceanisediminis]MBT0588083.1 cytochrome b/b6 domain-containing protein [Alteromonas oceanisediminis]